MRVLWLCNIMLPAIAEAMGMPYSNREGWLTGIYEKIRKEGEQVTLGICFPMETPVWGHFILKETNTICYSFSERLSAPEVYDRAMESRFREILEDFKPDVVHIFGTEFPHTLAMVRAFKRPDRTLIGIQGLCFACADNYMADLPERVVKRRTFRDRLKKDSIRQQQRKFYIRGEREKKALKQTLHITGRTVFDRRETEKINPKAEYHFMNETMRLPFYTGRWEAEKCIPYSIFLSQGDYPLKGFHYVLKALPAILKSYPRACVYVAGNSVIEHKTVKDKIKLSSYGKYLLELIRKEGLEKHVKVLGKLTAEEMKEQFLKSSVFLCPSSLENSPNSLGEAMLLGVPVVAACTGGIPSLIEDGKEGLLYPAGNVDALAQAVIQVWKEPGETAKRADAAGIRARETHDGDKNYKRLLEIYGEICK